jgi:hypothetical protein
LFIVHIQQYIQILNILFPNILSLCTNVLFTTEETTQTLEYGHINPLNPNASLNNDTMQRQLFPKDEMLHNTIKSIEFQRLLGTDATTKEGQDYIAEY